MRPSRPGRRRRPRLDRRRARLDAPALAASARAAYVDGLALVLIVCAAIAVLGAALITAFMPSRGARHHETHVRQDREVAA